MFSSTSELLSTTLDGKTLIVASIGSNDNPHDHFIAALDLLFAAVGSLTVASIYQSQAIIRQPVDNEAYYLNSVIAFRSSQTIAELQHLLKSVEAQCGRDRTSHKVTMDIDLLLVGDHRTSVAGGVLPHADILQYAHVLRPLAEIFPDVFHPGLETTYAELWQEFDKQQVLQPIDFVWQDQVISTAPPCLIM